MKRFHVTILSILGLMTSMSSVAQDVDKLTVPLTDPSRQVYLKVSLLSGSISVAGTSGKEVIVEARNRYLDHSDRSERKSGKGGGLRLIPNTSTGLTVEEDDNEVEVSTSVMGGARTIDLTIQVPTNTSMKLSTVNDGDVEVSNVSGDIEVSNVNGPVRLEKISGSAVVDALNGKVEVTFEKVNAQKSMSFSSLNGDIDVTFPASIKATVSMKTEQGEIYSDFDMQMDKPQSKVEENEKRKGRGRYRVTLERGMRGTINGGGAEMQFKNFNGDIYIRKGK